ncbi:MAG: glycosyltransferase family 4 protein [Candidatus Stygibacter australis]|nr:glycosyltransferase family 4 protein [Candidatus Stygibacter australis]
MKVFYIDANAVTPQYNYPILESLQKEQVDVTLYSTVNRYISEYYIDNYDVQADYFYFRIANKIKNQNLRKLIKVLSYPFESLKFLKKVRKIKPDVVHYNWLAVPIIDLFIIKKIKEMKIPVVITRHDFIPHDLKRPSIGDMQCLGLADRIICLSNAVKNLFPKDMQKKITIITHGNTYEKELKRFQIPKTSKDNSDLKVLLIGNLKPYKGALLLLQAVKELLTENIIPEIKLKLVGKCDAGLMKDIEDYIGEHKLDKIVERVYRFIDYDEMFNHVIDSDVGILPYIWGSQSGLPYIFYAFNKPLILSNVSGISEQGNEKISLVIEPNVEQIKQAIIKYKAIRPNYDPQDFEDYQSRNDLNTVIREMKSMYSELIGGKLND